MELDLLRLELNGEFAAILDGQEPRAGVEHLRTEELYFFEQRLPDAVRAFGRTYVPGKKPATRVPAGFVGPLGHLFEPRFVSAFVRLDLSLTDKVLKKDLQLFLERERRALKAIGGKQPFREAVRMLGKCNQANLRAFAEVGLLPFLDVEQWLIDSGAPIPADAAYARMLGITTEDLREARKKAQRVLDDFILRGWLRDAARDAVRKSSS
jgi:hypothetical protein